MNNMDEFLNFYSMKDSEHDFFKNVASTLMYMSYNKDEIISLVYTDYRFAKFLNHDKLSENDYLALLTSNVKTFYTFYDTCSLVIYQHALTYADHDDNISSTILRSITKYHSDRDSFDFVMRNFDKFENNYNMSYFLNSLKTLSYDDVNCLVKHNLLRYADFYYGECSLNNLAENVVSLIKNDQTYFYALYCNLAKSGHMQSQVQYYDFLNCINDIGITYNYKMLVDLINMIKDDTHKDYVTELVRLCIDRNWLSVFADCNLNYTDYLSTIFLSDNDLDFSKIQNFSKDEFDSMIIDRYSEHYKSRVKRFAFKKYYVTRLKKIFGGLNK